MTYSHKNEDELSNSVEEASSRGLGIRHVQIGVMATAAFIAYTLRINLSVAIVSMVDGNNTAHPSIPTYDWNEEVQGYVLGSFFWGYLTTQIPAGVLTVKFGGHRFLCAAILASSALSLAFPYCADMGGWKLACLNRILQGTCQGFVFPSIFTLLGVWAPPIERSRLANVAVSAQLLGTVVSTPVSGLLSSEYGWPSVFYVIGGVGACVGVVMIFLGADFPSKHRMISDTEINYIHASLGGTKEKLHVPWKHILTSVPYFALVCTTGFHASVYTTFLTKIPTFLGTVLGFGIAENGVFSALPFLVSWLFSFVCSWICDVMISRRWTKITTARKLFNSIAQFGGAIFLVLLALSDNRTMSVIFLTLSMGIQAGVFVGVQASYVDLAPNFSGTIFSGANFLSAMIGSLGPTVVGLIVTEKGSVHQWRLVFYICATLLVLSNIVFLIWGTAETQFWNWPDKYKNEQEYKVKREEEVQLKRDSVC